MTTTVIECNGLSKTYRSGWGKSHTALCNLELNVNEGEVFGFIGPNGAGKSTTIRILMGLMEASSGTAKMLGKHVSDSRSRKNVSYVPESPLLYEQLTPSELLMLHCAMQQVKPSDIPKRVSFWLERFDLSHVAKKQIRGFSKGMTQRTALAHAMVINPKLMILDEPLSGLDPIGRSLVVDILDEYRNQGGSLFFSSHVLYDVERLADRYGFIHNGILRTVQTPNEICLDDSRFTVVTWGEHPIVGMSALGGLNWKIDVAANDLWSVLQSVHIAGHQIREVKSSTSLEQAFLKYTKK
ncbi:ABC transporter ATP-binding protein [Chitinibacteraceae bacterium HSL-7]